VQADQCHTDFLLINKYIKTWLQTISYSSLLYTGDKNLKGVEMSYPLGVKTSCKRDSESMGLEDILISYKVGKSMVYVSNLQSYVL
jgi:hypothetical protein